MAVNIHDWFQGDIPNNLYEINFKASGGKKEYQVSIVNCDGTSNISFQKATSASWCDLTWNSSTNMLTISAQTNNGSIRSAKINKYINGICSSQITVYQEEIATCYCYDYTNGITWNYNIIPSTGLTAGTVIGHFNGGCMQNTANTLSVTITSGSTTINTTTTTATTGCDITLNSAISANTDISNENIYVINVYRKNTLCTSKEIHQEKKELSCDCGSIDYFINFNSIWPLSGSNGSSVFIGSADTRECGEISAVTRSPDVINNIQRTVIGNGKFSFSGVVASTPTNTETTGTLDIYFRETGGSFSLCKTLSIYRKSGCVTCDCHTYPFKLSTSYYDVNLCNDYDNSTYMLLPNSNNSAHCYSDYCVIEANNYYSSIGYGYKWWPLSITTSDGGDWMTLRNDGTVYVSNNYSQVERTGTITYHLYINTSGAAYEYNVLNDRQSAIINYRNNARYCTATTAVITQVAQGECKCCFIDNPTKSLRLSTYENDDLRHPGLFGQGDRYLCDDKIYASGSKYRIRYGSVTSATTIAIDPKEDSCGTITMTGGSGSWCQIIGGEIVLTENNTDSVRTAYVDMTLRTSDNSSCATASKEIIQLPIANNQNAWPRYMTQIIEASRYMRDVSCLSPTKGSSYNVPNGPSCQLYTYTLPCSSQTINYPSQIQNTGGTLVFNAYTSDASGNSISSSWITVSSGAGRTDAYKEYSISISENENNSSQQPRIGYVTLRNTSFLPYYIIQIVQNPGCGSVTPSCSCGSYSVSAKTSFISSNSEQLIATVTMGTTCMTYTVMSTTSGNDSEVTSLRTSGNNIYGIVRIKSTSSLTTASGAIDVYFFDSNQGTTCGHEGKTFTITK